MNCKHKDAIRLQTPEGLFLVEMEEISRVKLTTKDDLTREISMFIKQTIDNENRGYQRTRFDISPVDELAHRIANFLEERGWFIAKPLPDPPEGKG